MEIIRKFETQREFNYFVNNKKSVARLKEQYSKDKYKALFNPLDLQIEVCSKDEPIPILGID